MKRSRLFKIIYYLLNHGSVTAPELAKEMEVSVRTIYRDIDVLSGAGIPVYVTTGRNGGIHLMNDFVLDKALLTEKEKQDILSAIQELSVANAVYTKETLQKLSALFNLTVSNWYEVDFSRWSKKTQDNSKFEILKNAIINCVVVKIIYVNTSGIYTERKIQPLKLLYRSKEWYVKAYCMKKQDFRIFKMNRILQYELLEETFTPKSFPETNHEDGCFETIRLHFHKEAAYRVYDEFDESQIEKQENGDLITFAKMPQDEWLIGYLLSFGIQVEVIEPLSLRQQMAEQVKKLYEFYKP